MDRKDSYIRIAFYLMAALSCASCSFSSPPAPSPAPLAPSPSRASRAPPAPSRPAPSPTRPPRSTVTAHAIRNARAPLPSPQPRVIERIHDTRYSLLNDIGAEEPGYGLYSYAILAKHGDRSTEFLYDVFSTIEPVEGLRTPHSQLNLLSIPSRSIPSRMMELMGSGRSRASFAEHFYDYSMARALLIHLCDSVVNQQNSAGNKNEKILKAACESDLSSGPYIFTYAQPASKLDPVPPPFLFIDLSDVHERAFPTIIAAFLAQVKREDFSDREKIDTLTNNLLSIVLTAAGWITPVQKAMADIVYSASGQAKKDKE